VKGKRKNTVLKEKTAANHLPEEIAEGKTTEPYHKGVDTNKILDLRLKGLTFLEIKDLVGCSRQNVSQIIKKNFPNIDGLNSYKEYKDRVLEANNKK
jgi:hypothetical protein